MKTVLFIGLISLLPALSLAAEIPSDFEDILALFSEEKIVITPSHYPQSIGQSPASVTVITAEEIHASGAITIPDILRRVPGMEVMQMTSTEYNVSIRGNNQLLSNKLLVLLNGRAFHEEVQNTVPWAALPISLEEIARIEIVRGPGSAIWGANAFDGVVNIITKSIQPGDATFFSGRIGEKGTAVGDLYHAHGGDKFDANFSIGYQQTDALGTHGNGLEVYRGNTLLKYHLSGDKSVGLSAGMSHLPKYEGPLFNDGLSNSDTDYSYIQLDYKTPRSSLRAYWNQFDIDLSYFIFRDEIHPFQFSHDLYVIEGQHQITVTARQKIITGFQYRSNHIRGDFFEDKQRLQNIGAYLQNEWRPSSRFTVTIGSRYDHNDTTENIFSPQASLIYFFPEGRHSLRLSANTAYRSPTAIELFEEDGGNIHLSPERITSYEVGYKTFLFGNFKGRATLFYNRLEDLINVQERPNENRDKAEIYGGELEGEFLANRWLTFFANFAYQKIHMLSVILPKNIGREGPEHKINSGIKVHSGGFNSQLLLHYKSKVNYPVTVISLDLPERSEKKPSALLTNFWIGYHPFDEDDVEVGLSVFNLFNNIHREFPRADAIKRRVLFHINFRF